MKLDKALITGIAAKYAQNPYMIMALTEVESAGTAYWPVSVSGVTKMMSVIRWEGHYFYNLLEGDQRARAVAEGLASKTAGAVANPKSGDGRYALLRRAMAIDPNAALRSISMGVGQVMGDHYKALGFSSVVEMWNMAQSGVAGQIELMCKFINESPTLTRAVNGLQFPTVARLYNGRGYKRNAYDRKIEEAYIKYRTAGEGLTQPTASTDAPAAAGGWIAELKKLGYTDIKAFQSENNLVADGIIGPATIAVIEEKLRKAQEVKLAPVKWYSKLLAGGMSGLIALITGAVSQGKDAVDGLKPAVDALTSFGGYGGYVATALTVAVVGTGIVVYVINYKTKAA